MRGAKAKMLRKAAEHKTHAAPMEDVQMHHFAETPVFETHTRVIRSWSPRAGKIVSTEVEKVLLTQHGRLQHPKPLIKFRDDEKDPAIRIPYQSTELVPVTRPRRLKVGSSKRVYKTLKLIERREGLDTMFKQLHQEAA